MRVLVFGTDFEWEGVQWYLFGMELILRGLSHAALLSDCDQ